MTDLAKYALATIVLFFFFGAIFLLSELIPRMIQARLPL